jgi:hypothetical protein
LLPHREDAGVEASLEKLRSRKQQVAKNLQQRHAATRFEPDMEEDSQARELDEVLRDVASPPAAQGPASASPREETDEESYTDRLLKAKKRARDQRKQ